MRPWPHVEATAAAGPRHGGASDRSRMGGAATVAAQMSVWSTLTSPIRDWGRRRRDCRR